MTSYGKRPVNDALSYHGRKSFEVTFKGDKRRERKPYGELARLVDPGGHVMLLQVSTPGDGRGQSSYLRAQHTKEFRAAKIEQGWIPHGECPLRHETHRATRQLAEEFLALPANLAAPCEADPKTHERFAGATHMLEGCPHVEWLIRDRRQRQADELAKNYPDRAAQERLEAEKRELHSAQLEVARAQLAEERAKAAKKPAKKGEP